LDTGFEQAFSKRQRQSRQLFPVVKLGFAVQKCGPADGFRHGNGRTGFNQLSSQERIQRVHAEVLLARIMKLDNGKILRDCLSHKTGNRRQQLLHIQARQQFRADFEQGFQPFLLALECLSNLPIFHGQSGDFRSSAEQTHIAFAVRTRMRAAGTESSQPPLRCAQWHAAIRADSLLLQSFHSTRKPGSRRHIRQREWLLVLPRPGRERFFGRHVCLVSRQLIASPGVLPHDVPGGIVQSKANHLKRHYLAQPLRKLRQQHSQFTLSNHEVRQFEQSLVATKIVRNVEVALTDHSPEP
jgi:hypothetical protein